MPRRSPTGSLSDWAAFVLFLATLVKDVARGALFAGDARDWYMPLWRARRDGDATFLIRDSTTAIIAPSLRCSWDNVMPSVQHLPSRRYSTHQIALPELPQSAPLRLSNVETLMRG